MTLLINMISVIMAKFADFLTRHAKRSDIEASGVDKSDHSSSKGDCRVKELADSYIMRLLRSDGTAITKESIIDRRKSVIEKRKRRAAEKLIKSTL